MSYLSFVFAGFVILTVLLYYIFPLKYRYLILLFASLLFYYSNSKTMVLMVVISTLVIYFAAGGMSKNNHRFTERKSALDRGARKVLKAEIKKKNKRLLLIAILLNLALLVFLKYGNFIIENINMLLERLIPAMDFSEIPLMQIAVPLGISYYTLMAISYVTDVFRGQIDAEKNPLKLLLFLTFFPYIVEGPIGRYNQLSGQLGDGNTFDYSNFQAGLWYLISGMFKKMVIADRIAIYVNEIFTNYTNYNGLAVLAAIVLYVIQIYADFSGSIEIVTGIARFFGIKLDKNFKQPFFSKSIQEFWRRWHITLGSWLKDYIFYPISLSKGLMTLSKKIKSDFWAPLIPALIANLAVWLTMGIWHGASWKYVIYGLYYFILVAASIIFQPMFVRFHQKCKWASGKAYDLFQNVRTFLLVTFGMLIFRSDTLTAAVKMVQNGFSSLGIHTFKEQVLLAYTNAGYDIFGWTEIFILAASLLVLFLMDYMQAHQKTKIRNAVMERPLIIRWIIEIGMILIILCIGIYGPAYSTGAFIYGGF